MNASIHELAVEMKDEILRNAHAALDNVDVHGDLALVPGSDDEAIFDTGVMAGWTETMRWLMQRGLLSSGDPDD